MTDKMTEYLYFHSTSILWYLPAAVILWHCCAILTSTPKPEAKKREKISVIVFYLNMLLAITTGQLMQRCDLINWNDYIMLKQ